MEIQNKICHRLLYFRNKKSQTYGLSFRSDINLSAIIPILSLKQKINTEDIVLFYRGKKLQKELNLTTLSEHSIIHIVNMKSVNKKIIKIIVRMPNLHKISITLNANTLVKQFILQYIGRVSEVPAFQIGLIYLGKVMNLKKTLREQYIQDQCEIIALDIRPYLKNSRKLITENIIQPNIQLTGQTNNQIQRQFNQIQTFQNQQKQQLKPIKNSQNSESNNILFQLVNENQCTQLISNKINNIQENMLSIETTNTHVQMNKVQVQEKIKNEDQIKCSEENFVREIAWKDYQEAMLEPLSSAYLQPGDFMYAGYRYASETENILTKIFDEYRYLIIQNE